MRYTFGFVLPLFIIAGCAGAPPAASPAELDEPEGTTASTKSEPATSASELSDAADADDADGADEGTQTPAAGDEGFVLRDAKGRKDKRDNAASKIQPSRTEAALKFTVVDKEKGPIPGIVISLTAPDGTKFYTAETNAEGYSEVLVPVGQKYDIIYLSLGRQDITTSVDVTEEPRQTIRLTLRYKRFDNEGGVERFVLKGVNFDTGKATLRPDSLPRLEGLLEYMTHKPSVSVEISGHTDNVGDPKANKQLSEQRAKACRDYLVSKGIDGSRIKAVGYGAERPLVGNDTPEGRQENRRIEATELR